MDFSVETWACIDVIKICPHIDLELKYAQSMFKQTGGNVKSSTFIQRQEYIRLLKKFDLLPNRSVGEVDFFDIITQAINNKYFVLSEQLLHRHVLRDRIHENNNKVLRKVIRQKNIPLSQYLLTFSKVKKALVEPKNKVLITAVLGNLIEIVDSLLSISGVKETAHHNRNSALFESMNHCDLVIFRKLINLTNVKANFFQVLPKICEFLNPEILAKAKSDINLDKFHENEIIKYALDVSRAGHVLGLSNEHLPTDMVFPMNFSGSYSRKSLSWVLDHLGTSLKNSPKSEFKKNINIIFSIFKVCSHYREKMFNDNYRENIGHTAHIDLFNLFLQNKMIYLISGWKGHEVGIVLYRADSCNIFIGVINRGEFGDKNFGTKIFKVTKNQGTTADWIRKIQLTKSYEEFLSLLKLVIDVDKILLTLPQKPQKHSTCGYVNKVASIELMLLLLRAKFSKEISKLGGLQRIYDQYKRDDYKKITCIFRDQEVKRIIGKMQSQYYKSELMYDLIRSIILQHPGKTDRNRRPEKFEAECQRARNLLKALPEFYQNKFKKMHQDLYHLIDFDSVINPAQKWILVDYNKKRTQNRVLYSDKSNQTQSQPRLSLKLRY